MTKKTSIIVVISVAIILISLILSIYIPNKDKIGEEIEDESIVYTVINENEKFDLVIVDGPLGVNQETPRTNIINLIPQNIAKEFIIIIDDYERKGEQNTVKLLLKKLNDLKIKHATSVISGMKKQILITSEHCKYLHWI